MKFDYEARTTTGEVQRGIIEAASEEAALETLRQYNLVILDLGRAKEGGLSKEIAIFSRVKKREIVIFSRQLSVLVDAQVPLIEALQTLAEQTETSAFRKKLQAIAADIDAGTSLSRALSSYPKLFSKFYRSVVEAGEVSGRLQEVLLYLADHEERSYDLNRKVRGALIYPAFIIFSIVVVGAIMMIFVVPQLTSIFEETGAELPILTRIVVAVSNFLQGYWWLALILLVGAAFGGVRYVRTSGGRELWDTFLLNVPVLKILFRKIYLTRFAENLSTLIKGGVPIIEALRITGEVVGNTIYQRVIVESAEAVSRGGTISSVLADQKGEYIPKLVVQMVHVGEETGKLDGILAKIGSFYKKDVDNMVDNLTTLIQPILILVLGAAAGILVAAILLPIYNLSSSL